VYSAYPGAVGLSKTFESFGQRDEATMIALHAALDFQTRVGRAAIEQRARALTTQLMDGLAKIPGLTVWTSPVAERRAAVVTFVPGALDANKLANALYEKDRIGITTRGGKDRPGIRVSPHFYNTPQEVDRLLAAVTKYTKSGV
jgi:selenocysteine lyase/cysteine desulfurase